MFKRTRTNSSVLWRIADVACALLAISYVLFDVLDLDGSNTCRFVARTNRLNNVVAEVTSEIQIDDSQELTDLRLDARLHPAHLSTEFTGLHQPNTLAIPLTKTARSHGDRGCRPDHPVTDLSPDH